MVRVQEEMDISPRLWPLSWKPGSKHCGWGWGSGVPREGHACPRRSSSLRPVPPMHLPQGVGGRARMSSNPRWKSSRGLLKWAAGRGQSLRRPVCGAGEGIGAWRCGPELREGQVGTGLVF